MSDFSYSAPPNVFGPWQTIASYGGEVQYTLSASPLGDTQIFGEVRFGAETRSFADHITFRTRNEWSNVDVRFKGIPLGTAIHGSILP